jgi:hypothetical protein
MTPGNELRCAGEREEFMMRNNVQGGGAILPAYGA